MSKMGRFHVLCRHRALVVFLLVCLSTTGAANPDTVYRKCCPETQGLVKLIGEEPRYECRSRIEVDREYYINSTRSSGTLVIAASDRSLYGFPEDCEASGLREGPLTTTMLSTPELYCLDQVILELSNETSRARGEPPDRVIVLTCSASDDIESSIEVNYIRKCCKEDEEYDVQKFTCVPTELSGNSTEELIRKLVKEEDGLYSVEVGLTCRLGRYSVTYPEQRFQLEYSRGQLVAWERGGRAAAALSRHEYCVERAGRRLVARACQAACAPGAVCVRKCCPHGHHYVPRTCGLGANVCVPGTHGFTPTFHTGKYMAYKEAPPPEWLGLAPPMNCSEGRFRLTNSTADQHYLLHSGELVVPKMYKMYALDEYCMETVDRTACPSASDTGVTVETIMCFVSPANIKSKFAISFVAICISCVFLALTLLVYAALAELRNLHGMTLMCHVASMLVAYCCLARVQGGRIELSSLCKLHGYAIYFCFMAAFSWLCVMCFDIWWTFGSVKTVQRFRKAGAERRRFLWYSLCAWGAPVTLTAALLLCDLFPVTRYLDADIGDNFCWFGSVQNDRTDWPHYIFFVGPVGALTGVNLVLWAATARHCARVKSELRRVQAGSFRNRAKMRFLADKAKYTLVVKLWVVMGAGWVWEVLSTVVEEPRWFWLGVDLVNELQGVFIFIILVLKPKVLLLVRKKLGLEKAASGERPTSTRSTFLSRSTSSEERTHLRVSRQPTTPLPATDLKPLS